MNDETTSPYIKKINECCKIIEQIENDKLGTSEAITLSTYEKYKLGILYL
jgi:hypothetical protein